MIHSAFKMLTSAALLLLFMPLTISAAQHSDKDELEVSILIKDFDYQELSPNNQVINKENGLIAGLGLVYHEQYGSLALQLEAALYDGTVDYTGQSQSGSPITSRSDAKIGELNLFMTHWMKQQSQMHFGLYTGLGLYYWQRNIRSTTTATGSPVAGLLEKYLIGYGSLGAKMKFLISDQSNGVIDIRASKLISANIDVDFQGFGGFDKTSLDIGKQYGYRVALAWEKKLSRVSSMIITPYYEYWKFGESNTTELTINGQPSGTNILEPKSETSNVGLNIGFRQIF